MNLSRACIAAQVPCQIVLRQAGTWECQPKTWVSFHLKRAMGEEVVAVNCRNASEEIAHLHSHVGKPRRRLQVWRIGRFSCAFDRVMRHA